MIGKCLSQHVQLHCCQGECSENATNHFVCVVLCTTEMFILSYYCDEMVMSEIVGILVRLQPPQIL